MSTLEERFWSKVEITDTCWLWLGYLEKGGYGRFRVGNVMCMAHRFSYMYFVRPIPEGLTIDHLCRVRNCVRPDHLEPVTQLENNRRGDSDHNKFKFRCKYGHAFNRQNTRLTRLGRRQCRKCDRIRHREKKEHNDK